MSGNEAQTRRTARGAATRARIIDTAAELMFSAGVANTSLDAVLEASHTSKSQLYHYFANKDDLVLAVIERQTEHTLDAQQPQLGALDSLDGLRRWRDALVEIQRQRNCIGGCPIGSLASELAESPAPRARIAQSFEEWESYLIAGFTAMRERGELAPETYPRDLATAVLSAVEGGLLLAQTTRDTRPLELALDMAIEHVASRVHPAR